MTLKQIKDALNDGLTVCWSHDGYQVVKDSFNQYLIKCLNNGHCIGLTHQDGLTMNGKESQFFIKEKFKQLELNLIY